MLRRSSSLLLFKRRAGLFLSYLALSAAPLQAGAAEKIIDYVSKPPASAVFIVDTRPAGQCEAASLESARCLPARDFLGRHKSLTNFSGLLWLLGTAALKGDEHVLLIGDQSRNKEFMAGVLYLAGQKKISVLTRPVKSLAGLKMTPGENRSKTREQVYQAGMRTSRIVLRSDLVAMLRKQKPPVILDGRSEDEYWGETIRAARGGHLPGAQNLAMTFLRPGKNNPPPIFLATDATAIAYGHGSYQGLIYLARLVASGIDAKLYLEGWVGWASDGALPADNVSYTSNVSYTGRTNVGQPKIERPEPAQNFGLRELALLVLAGAGVFAAGFFTNRAIKG